MSACGADVIAGLSTFSMTLFALACESQLHEATVLLAPLSVAGALAICQAGATAGGKGENELLASMHLRNHSQVAELAVALQAAGSKETTVRIANSIWTRGGIKPDFVKAASLHGARAAELPGSYNTVNAWVAEQTNGKITGMLQGAPDPLIKAVLVNAVYFSGHWAEQFDPKATVPGSFITSSEEQLVAQFMQRTGELPIAENVELLGGSSILRLDYAAAPAADSAAFCALLVLPSMAGTAALTEVVNGLRTTSIARLLQLQHKRRVELSLPRFTAQWGSQSLKEMLRRLGLSAVFDGTGEFLGMHDDPQVHIDDVLHKTLMEVNEEGTVAAAATAVMMKTRSMPMPPLKMNFNRPFLMMVVHVHTGLPLFLGQFNRPQFS